MTSTARRLGRWVGRAATAAALLGLGLALAACGGAAHHTAAGQTGTVPRGLVGLVPEPLPRKPSFTLPDTSGRPYSFARATRGKLTYLFFGYTHCPDACPATMSGISYALRLQPPSVRTRIAVVFVTVDPRRDTGPVIRRWLDHYGRSFVGLTGSPAQIEAVERAAGVPPAPPAGPGGTAKGYAVTHSSFLLAYSPDGLAHVVYAEGFTPADYAHDLPLLLRFGS